MMCAFVVSNCLGQIWTKVHNKFPAPNNTFICALQVYIPEREIEDDKNMAEEKGDGKIGDSVT
jgi:hypothetical protein